MTHDVRGTASVRVAATSANLGPGFDSLGLALGIYDDVTVEIVENGVHIEMMGEGADSLARDETHLVLRSLRAALERMDARAPGITLRSINRIPHGRGLGSSAAAICAGVLLARSLVLAAAAATPAGAGSAVGEGTVLDGPEMLALAGEIEGHPDNVAACLLGGATLAWTDAGSGQARAIRLPLDAALHAAVFIPDFESSTELARGLLPATVAHADAAANAARSAMLVAALAGRLDLLLSATEDRLHQPYRAGAMPASAALMDTLRANGIAATISGAGPSVLVMTATAAEVARTAQFTPTGWRQLVVPIAWTGALAD